MTQHASDTATLFITIGGLLLLGLAADYIGRKTKLPRVTLLFLFGFLLGPGVLGLLPVQANEWMPVIANIALLLVGFLLGGKLTVANTLENGIVVAYVSISVVLSTLAIVSFGLIAIGTPVALALLFSGIATATDPAATMDSIKETDSSGKFTDTLQGIVSIDDAWGLIAFTLVLAAVKVFDGDGGSWVLLGNACWELVGAVGVGVILGLPMAYVSGRIKPGQPTLLEAMGMVLLCGGIAQYLGVSYLLSSMVLGAVVTNLANHHERSFHEIEDVEWPFMVLFFTLTGASLVLDSLSQVGWLAAGYIAFRTIARVIGCWPGATLAGSIDSVRLWMGLALLPQAGVATGMALIASAQFPELAGTIIPVVVIATMFFEMVGPIFTRISLTKAGNTRMNIDSSTSRSDFSQ